MSEHPIQGLMKSTMENLKEMIDVNTVVGAPVNTPGGGVVIPVSRVSFGFAAGGGEYEGGEEHRPKETEWPFGGGSGAGVSVQPVGFLVVDGGQVRLLPVDGNAVFDRLIEVTPKVLDQMAGFFRGGKENANSSREGTLLS